MDDVQLTLVPSAKDGFAHAASRDPDPRVLRVWQPTRRLGASFRVPGRPSPEGGAAQLAWVEAALSAVTLMPASGTPQSVSFDRSLGARGEAPASRGSQPISRFAGITGAAGELPQGGPRPADLTFAADNPLQGKIRPGMKAQVRTDSAPDKPIAGRIGYISSVAEFTPKTVQTTDLRTDLVYEIRVLVDDPLDSMSVVLG